jgi:hypothetical protein
MGTALSRLSHCDQALGWSADAQRAPSSPSQATSSSQGRVQAPQTHAVVGPLQSPSRSQATSQFELLPVVGPWGLSEQPAKTRASKSVEDLIGSLRPVR